MKLPGIRYDRPVQSLGRSDVYGPIRVANAWADASRRVSGAIEEINRAKNETDLAAAKSRILRKMGRLNGEITSKKSFHVDELNDLGVDFKSETQVLDDNGNLVTVDREYIPAHEVMDQIYEVSSKNILESEYENIPDKTAQNELGLFHSRIYSQGVEQVISARNIGLVEEMSAKVDQQFTDAVNAGDLIGATNIAESALKTGLWDATHYQRNVTELPSKVRSNQYVVATSSSSSIPQLERIKAEALFDDSLTPSDRASALRTIDGKLSDLKREAEARARENRINASLDRYVNLSTQILDQGQPMDWRDIRENALTMENGDAKTLITLNRSMAEGGGTNKSDPDFLNRMSVMIRGLSVPGDDTLANRRAHIVQELHRAMGYDPVTGDRVGNAYLSATDYSRLMDQVNKATEFKIDNPEVKTVSEYIWTTLTGAPKTGMGSFLDQTGLHSILAAQAEYDLNRAAMESGIDFDPHAWWDRNKESYMTKQVRDNVKRARESVKRLSDGSNPVDHIVTDAEGNVDKDATLRNLEEEMRSDAISEEDVKEIVNGIFGPGQ